MKTYAKKYISWIITIGLIVLFFWYAFANPDLLEAVVGVSFVAVVVIAVGRLATIISNGLFTKWTVEAFTDRMSTWEGFRVAVYTAVGNFFGPLLGGLGIRAVYLKKVHNLPYSKFTATLIGYYLVMFIFNSLLAIIGLLLLPQTEQTSFLLFVFGAWLAAFVAFAFVRMPKRQPAFLAKQHNIIKRLYKVIQDIADGWALLKSDKKLFVRMSVLAVINLALIVLITAVEFLALKIPIDIPALLLYSALVQVSLLISITPGSIGIREALLLVVATTLGVTSQEILQVALLDRAVQFFLIGVLFLFTRHSSLYAYKPNSTSEK